MNIRICYDEISSFVGDVRPIWLVSDIDLKHEKIEWSCKGDTLKMKRCAGCFHGAFRYGVLITFLKEGEATVTATYGGNSYTCRVISRKRKTVSDGEKLNYYVGDFHTHTTPEHTHDLYLERTEFLPKDYLNYINNENLRDAAVMTDHSETIDLESFFKNFTEYELMKDGMEPIVYAGCENEIMYAAADRFGRTHRLSGELVTINADNFCQANTYPEFLWAFTENPYAIGIFAHPHVIGISTNGVWDYKFRQNNSPELRSLMKYVEVFNSPYASDNVLNEYAYSEALDGGYRVSTTCGSDQHRDWDFSSFPAATIIMAPEKSREAFTDALLNLRVYASESGNIKLSYKVNGKSAPCDLELADKYHFEVKIDYFREDKATRPIRCEVISNGGVTLKTIENVNFESFEFDIESDSARWFYLRFVDSNTKRTFSPPVFTGRSATPYVTDDLKPIDKSGFKVISNDGTDASALIDDDTFTEWSINASECELTIDMGKENKVSALGNYAAAIDIMELRRKGINNSYALSSFPLEYVISTSADGVSYRDVASGLFRSFAGEEIVRFEKHSARYVKLKVLSTTGSRIARSNYSDAPLRIAELSLFE